MNVSILKIPWRVVKSITIEFKDNLPMVTWDAPKTPTLVGTPKADVIRVTKEMLDSVPEFPHLRLTKEKAKELGLEKEGLAGLPPFKLTKQPEQKPWVKKESYRIAVVFFPIIEPYGINSYVKNLMAGLKALGHVTELFYATEGGRMRLLSEKEDLLVGKYVRLAGKQISYGDKPRRLEAKRLLNSFDMVLFAHQCPHPDIKKQGEREWQELYNLRVPIFTVFHDNYWDKSYPWLQEVADRIRVCLYTNPAQWEDSLQRFPGYFVYTPQMLDTSQAGLYSKSKTGRVIWLPQWKALKGIRQFVQSLPDIKYPVDLYNTGIEYYYLRKEKWWRDSIGADLWEGKKGPKLRGTITHVVHGPLLPDRVYERLKSANASVDFQGHDGRRTAGLTTYVMFESMLYGAVPIVHANALSNNSPLPEEAVWAVESMEPKDISRAVNDLMGDRKLQLKIAKVGLEWVRERFDSTKVAANVIRCLETDKIRDHAQLSKAVRNVAWEKANLQKEGASGVVK